MKADSRNGACTRISGKRAHCATAEKRKCLRQLRGPHVIATDPLPAPAGWGQEVGQGHQRPRETRTSAALSRIARRPRESVAVIVRGARGSGKSWKQAGDQHPKQLVGHLTRCRSCGSGKEGGTVLRADESVGLGREQEESEGTSIRAAGQPGRKGPDSASGLRGQAGCACRGTSYVSGCR